MASADALAFTYSPHELERAARHGSDRGPPTPRRSPRRLAISTRALTRAIKSCPTSPTGSIETKKAPKPKRSVSGTKAHLDDGNVLSVRDTPRREAGHIADGREGPASKTVSSPHPSYTFSVAADPEALVNFSNRTKSHFVFQSIPRKRARPLHDVDGPGTATFSCKKRRLRLHLVTSRLSQPFSLPATHIHNRENGDDDTPCISRFLKAAAIGAKRAGHESSMVRKAAILNSVRLKARQAAIYRGHAELAGLSARNTFLKHGQQVVTAPTVPTTGTRYPVSEGMPGHQRLPAGWRPHTTIGPGQASITAFAPPAPISTSGFDMANPTQQSLAAMSRSPSSPPITPTRQFSTSPKDLSPKLAEPRPSHDSEDDEEYGMAFPTSDLDSRYADLSDDDMDDVYADFSAIFGPRPGQDADDGPTPERDEHFYEEYLDELDGIPWMS